MNSSKSLNTSQVIKFNKDKIEFIGKVMHDYSTKTDLKQFVSSVEKIKTSPSHLSIMIENSFKKAKHDLAFKIAMRRSGLC